MQIAFAFKSNLLLFFVVILQPSQLIMSIHENMWRCIDVLGTTAATLSDFQRLLFVLKGGWQASIIGLMLIEGNKKERFRRSTAHANGHVMSFLVQISTSACRHFWLINSQCATTRVPQH